MNLLMQIVRFGFVGIVATLIHSILFLTALSLNFSPLFSNTLGFIIAFIFSFLAQSFWTFKVGFVTIQHLVKFGFTALIGFILNSAFVYLTMEIFSLSKYVALLGIIVITPMATFLLNKLWVYRHN